MGVASLLQQVITSFGVHESRPSLWEEQVVPSHRQQVWRQSTGVPGLEAGELSHPQPGMLLKQGDGTTGSPPFLRSLSSTGAVISICQLCQMMRVMRAGHLVHLHGLQAHWPPTSPPTPWDRTVAACLSIWPGAASLAEPELGGRAGKWLCSAPSVHPAADPIQATW